MGDKLLDDVKSIVKLTRSDENYPQIISLCNKLLKANPADQEALQTKMVCLIRENNFAAVISEAKGNASLKFELAYAFYRIGEHKSVLDILGPFVEGEKAAFTHLRAQGHFSLGNYNDATQFYEVLVKKSFNTIECRTNLLASYILAGRALEGVNRVEKLGSSEDKSFELTFNIAAALLETGDSAKAQSKINEAMSLCRSMHEADGFQEEEIVDELCVMKVQLAYILQMKGSFSEAEVLYHEVLHSKPSSKTVAAVCSNNLLSLKKRRDLGESFKRFKAVMSPDTISKLTPIQQQKVLFNNALLFLHMDKTDLCLAALKEIKEKYPSSFDSAILLASLRLQEKKTPEALSVLTEFATTSKDALAADKVWLTIAWIHLSQNNKSDAVSCLKKISKASFTPQIVGTLVSLFREMNEHGEAEAALSVALDVALERKDKNVFVLALEMAKFKVSNGKYAEAAAVLESLRTGKNELDGAQRMTVLATLVLVYSYYDADAAEKIAATLPAPTLAADVDVNIDELLDVTALRRVSSNFNAKKSLVVKGKTAEEVKLEANTEAIAAKKKARRKRNHLKRRLKYRDSFIAKLKEKGKFQSDFKPDAERWLPFRQRAKNKKWAKKKGHVAGGAQGAGDAVKLAEEAAKLDVLAKLNKEKETAAVAESVAAAESKVNKNAKKKGGKKKGKW